jgi:hypothetical protein
MPVSKTSTKKTTKTEETVAPAEVAQTTPVSEVSVETPVVEKKTKTTKVVKKTDVPVEPQTIPSSTQVVETTVETTVDTTVETTEGGEGVETSEEQSIQERITSMLEMNRMMGALHSKIQKQLKSLEKDYRSFVRRYNKMEEKRKQNKKKGGSTGLKKMIPVTTTTFKAFVEKFHELKDKHENVVYAELQYDASGNLLISREQALRLVNAYIADKKLQKYDDKKRIKMDPQLKTLFPMLCEHKDTSGKVVEENCYFHTLMKGIATHLQSSKTE